MGTLTHAVPYTTGGGSATRRWKWVKRVWFQVDEETYKRDSRYLILKSLAHKETVLDGLDKPLTEITDFGIITRGCADICIC